MALVMLSFNIGAEEAQKSFIPKHPDAYKRFINYVLGDNGAEDNVFMTATETNASEMIKAYKDSELKANKKYKNNLVRIKTVVSAVKEGVNNKPYIVANGRNQYESIRIYIDPSNERFLNLTKGNKIDLTCIGHGVVMDTPILHACLFSDEFLAKSVELGKKDLWDVVEKGTFVKLQEELGMLTYYLAMEDQIAAACENGDKKCIEAIQTQFDNRENKDGLNARATAKFKQLQREYPQQYAQANQKIFFTVLKFNK